MIAYLVHEQKIPAKYLVPKGYGWTIPKNKKKPAAAEPEDDDDDDVEGDEDDFDA